ncbi:DUF4352 domain-containing protein [Actinoplanes sp. G11-F43]|uniref:DUF4352 domain-containing protein n=1 Tax=Actinoplanes sp. G11-F43 TaxID=3424130 RepID=UPI003D344663
MNHAQNSMPATPAVGKRRWPWIAGAAVALMLLGCAGTTGEEAGSAAGTDSAAAESAEKPAEKKKEAEKAPGIGDAARDGKFQFTVTKVKCGVNKVGSDLLGAKAQGQFCLVDVTVKNIGKEAQTFLDSVQKAYDGKKVEYSVDSSAALYANDDQQVLFEEINPGNTVKGKLVFDIPKGTELTSLELHDSMFSGGVTVGLK